MQGAIAIPKRGPLHAGIQAVIWEEGIHLLYRIAKTGSDRAGPFVFDDGRELDRPDGKFRLRGDVAFE